MVLSTTSCLPNYKVPKYIVKNVTSTISYLILPKVRYPSISIRSHSLAPATTTINPPPPVIPLSLNPSSYGQALVVGAADHWTSRSITALRHRRYPRPHAPRLRRRPVVIRHNDTLKGGGRGFLDGVIGGGTDRGVVGAIGGVGRSASRRVGAGGAKQLPLERAARTTPPSDSALSSSAHAPGGNLVSAFALFHPCTILWLSISNPRCLSSLPPSL